MERNRRPSPFSSAVVVLALLFSWIHSADSQSFIGVNYGEVANNLPPPAATADLLRSTSISKVRLYNANAAIIQVLANTNISLVIATGNGDIPSLAGDPNAAAAWVASNVLPYYPASAISTVCVGNEVLLYGDANLAGQLLPAMQNMRAALAAQSLADKIKVSTVHPMSVLAQSDPPSSGTFDPAHVDALRGISGFLQQTGGPFMVNPYPFFAYRSDPRPETLAFCLFQQNPGKFDAGSQKLYANMFDAQLDAVRSALNREGFGGVEIVVAETGWPYQGDANEVGASVDNARAYNGNLVAHLRSMVGTPLVPGKSVDTYLFALYDEDLKPGPASERSFGLYKPGDLSPAYDAGLAKTSLPQASPNPAPATKNPAGWCVPKAEASDAQLQANLDYACGQTGIDCSPIQPGGACYDPNTVASHASYAMNLVYQAAGRHSWDCDFRKTATLTTRNPSASSLPTPGLLDQWRRWLRRARIHRLASWPTAALAVAPCVAGAHDLRKGLPWLYHAALVAVPCFVDLSPTASLVLIWCLFVYCLLA